MKSSQDAAVDVVLLRMPFSELGQPSLALGLLQESCAQSGVNARIIPANLQYAEECGPIIHNLIFEAFSTTLLGEWIFSSALFPDYERDDDAYLNQCIRLFKLDSTTEWKLLHRRYPTLNVKKLLRAMKAQSKDFVDKIADQIIELSPKIVGCTSMFQQQCASLALLKAIKAKRPDIITMLGGANCEGRMGETTFHLHPQIDYLVSGEADGFFGQLCKELIHPSPSTKDFPEGVYGPPHRASATSTVVKLQRPKPGLDLAPISRLESMDESPIPNYDDYFKVLTASPLGAFIKPALPFQTARGCWWGETNHCTFCGISKTAMKFRSKSPENVMEQMNSLSQRYGINTFQGTEYIFDFKYFKTLLPLMKELKSYFRFEVKANLKPQQLVDMLDAGVIEVQPGVESLDDRVLKLMDKGVTGVQNLLLLKRGKELGMSVYWNLLHTMPGDKDEWYGEMAENFKYYHHLQPPVAFASVHFDRFSPYWREPEKHGLTLLPAFGYEFVYPYSQEELADIAYFFQTPAQRESFLMFNEELDAGVLLMYAEAGRWKSAFWPETNGKDRPILKYETHGEGLKFTDTREIAEDEQYTVGALEKRIFLLLETGLSEEKLHKKLQCEPFDTDFREKVDCALQTLLSRGVVVRISGKLLAIAQTHDNPKLYCELPKVVEANSDLDPKRAQLRADRHLDSLRPSLVRKFVENPHDRKLSEWFS